MHVSKRAGNSTKCRKILKILKANGEFLQQTGPDEEACTDNSVLSRREQIIVQRLTREAIALLGEFDKLGKIAFRDQRFN